MELDNVLEGFKHMFMIVVIVAVDMAIVVRWLDAIYPDILPLTSVGFWDAFPMLFLTLLFGWITCEIANEFGEKR